MTILDNDPLLKYRRDAKALRESAIEESLAQCTKSQRAMFNRIFPNGVPASKVEDALRLIGRTLQKNATGRGAGDEGDAPGQLPVEVVDGLGRRIADVETDDD